MSPIICSELFFFNLNPPFEPVYLFLEIAMNVRANADIKQMTQTSCCKQVQYKSMRHLQNFFMGFKMRVNCCLSLENREKFRGMCVYEIPGAVGA